TTTIPFFIAQRDEKIERDARIANPSTPVNITIYCALMNIASSFNGTSASDWSGSFLPYYLI
ncbi:MAG: hypothetical protein ACYCXB_07530, partial [Candidatus Humimicrobiaceae bacterium]